MTTTGESQRSIPMLTTFVFWFISAVPSALAEEPSAVPATVSVPYLVNQTGLRNKLSFSVGWDDEGCPNGMTSVPQFMKAEEVAIILGAASSARTDCTIAKARAAAIRDEAEAERLLAEGRSDAVRSLALAGADAARAAAKRGEATFTDGENLVSATGGAAFVAAAGGGSVGGISPLDTYAYGRAAWDITRPVQKAAPPPATAPKPAAKKPDPEQTTVKEAEADARRAATMAAAAAQP